MIRKGAAVVVVHGYHFRGHEHPKGGTVGPVKRAVERCARWKNAHVEPFEWDSDGILAGPVEEEAKKEGARFRQVLLKLSRKYRHVDIVAHSMGTIVVHKALTGGCDLPTPLRDIFLLGGALSSRASWYSAITIYSGTLYNFSSASDKVLSKRHSILRLGRHRVIGRPGKGSLEWDKGIHSRLQRVRNLQVSCSHGGFLMNLEVYLAKADQLPKRPKSPYRDWRKDFLWEPMPVFRRSRSKHGVFTEIVQRALNAQNHQGTPLLSLSDIDGFWGTKTTRAVKNFQRQNHLSADGEVGQGTWKLLVGVLAELV